MKCERCSKPVFGNDGITVLGIGAAHVACFELEKNIRRVFAGINISQLDEHKLNELHDMVLAEKIIAVVTLKRMPSNYFEKR